MILCDPEKKELTLSVLPPSVRVTPGLERFVSLKGLTSDQLDQEWTDFVEDQPVLAYARQVGNVRYDLKGNLENAIAFLRFAFEISGEQVSPSLPLSTQFVDILKLFSTPEHRIQAEFLGKCGNKYSFEITLSVSTQHPPLKLTAQGEWDAHHADMSFHQKEQTVYNDVLIQNIFYAGKRLGIFLLGACNVSFSTALLTLIGSGVITDSLEIEEFLKGYSSGFSERISFCTMDFSCTQSMPFIPCRRILKALPLLADRERLGKQLTTYYYDMPYVFPSLIKTAIVNKNGSMLQFLLSMNQPLEVDKEDLHSLLYCLDACSDETVKMIVASLKRAGITEQEMIEVLFADLKYVPAAVFRKLEKEGVNFNALMSNGRTPLMEALIKDFPAKFEYLLSLDRVKMTTRSSNGQTIFDLFESMTKERLPLHKVWSVMGMLETLLGKITPSLTAEEKSELTQKQRHVPYEQRRRMVALYKKLQSEEDEENGDEVGVFLTITDATAWLAFYNCDILAMEQCIAEGKIHLDDDNEEGMFFCLQIKDRHVAYKRVIPNDTPEDAINRDTQITEKNAQGLKKIIELLLQQSDISERNQTILQTALSRLQGELATYEKTEK